MEPPDKKWAGLIIALLLLANVGYAHAPDVPEISDFIVIDGNTLRGNSLIFSLYLPSYGALGYNVRYYDLISQYDWNVATAYRIMMCESSGNPNAHNFSYRTLDDSWGLFQINLWGNLKKNRPSPEWLLVPENNIAYAHQMYLRNGWRPWRNCY